MKKEMKKVNSKCAVKHQKSNGHLIEEKPPFIDCDVKGRRVYLVDGKCPLQKKCEGERV